MPLTDTECINLCSAICECLLNKDDWDNLFDEKLELTINNSNCPMKGDLDKIKCKYKQNCENSQIKILIFEAPQLDLYLLDYESIITPINTLSHGNSFKILRERVISDEEIMQKIQEYKPEIVYFCGHGLEDGSFSLGQTTVKLKFLERVFLEYSNIVKCVIFNTCNSDKAAEKISPYIDYVVSMNNSILDKMAIKFANGFGSGLVNGYSDGIDIFLTGYVEGIIALTNEDYSQELIPVLKIRYKQGVLNLIKKKEAETKIGDFLEKLHTSFPTNKLFNDYYHNYLYPTDQKQDEKNNIQKIQPELIKLSLKLKFQNKELKELVAESSLAKIYKVTDKKTERKEAIKILVSEDLEADFDRSVIEAVQISDEPNFISIYDVNLSEKPHYYIMQYIEGKTLRQIIDRRELTVNETRRIMISLVRALVEVQKLDKTYGDIKPSNIIIKKILHPDQSEHEPFISPFHLWENLTRVEIVVRLSKLLADLDVSNESKKKEYLEELVYLLPEKFDQFGDNSSSDKSTQYMLGILAYELLTCKLPPSLQKFEDLEQKNGDEFKKLAEEINQDLEKKGDRVFRKRSKSLNFDNNPITKENLACSRFFEEVILRMMSPNPNDRYSTLQEALNLLENIDVNLNLAKESYTSCVHNKKFDEEFFNNFYDELREKCPYAAKKFPLSWTEKEWKHQHQLLKEAILLLFAYYEQGKRFENNNVSEPNILSAIAKTHSSKGKDIPKDLYVPFIEALINTVIKYDPFSRDERHRERVKIAWQNVIDPGVKYMQSKYSSL